MYWHGFLLLLHLSRIVIVTFNECYVLYRLSIPKIRLTKKRLFKVSLPHAMWVSDRKMRKSLSLNDNKKIRKTEVKYIFGS